MSPDLDSSLKDSIDQCNLANPADNFVDSMPEMFVDEHAPDYSSPLIFDEYDDDFLKVESDTENVYDDPFDSKGEKSKSILSQEKPFEIITRVVQDKKLTISNASLVLEDFDPPFYEPLFFKEVPKSKMLLLFSSEIKEKVFKPGIHTSEKVHSSFIPELSHQGYKVFKINQIFKSLMKIFLFSCGKDTHILAVPCLHFYPIDQFKYGLVRLFLEEYQLVPECSEGSNIRNQKACSPDNSCCGVKRFVGIKSLLDAVEITTAQVFVNTAQLDFDSIIETPPRWDTTRFLVIHQPPQEISIQEIEDLKQQYLDEMKCLINLEYRDEIKIDKLKGYFNRMSIEINKKEKLQQLEQVANLSTYPSKRFNSFCYDDDDDEDYTVVITHDFPITDSLIMDNEHLDTIPETKSDEFIKSSVENLVPILNSEGDNLFLERLLHDDPISLSDILDFSNVV
nr:hypothetical protein [Tanacetum cinerariifolium]